MSEYEGERMLVRSKGLGTKRLRNNERGRTTRSVCDQQNSCVGGTRGKKDNKALMRSSEVQHVRPPGTGTATHSVSRSDSLFSFNTVAVCFSPFHASWTSARGDLHGSEGNEI